MNYRIFLSILAISSSAIAGDPPVEISLKNESDASFGIRPILDIRTSYEFRDEEPFDASNALITRARLGLQTDEWNGWSSLVEGELTRAIIDDYKSNPTGSAATQPFVQNNTVIYDPENLELNRAWVQYQNEGFIFKAGRHHIIRNNQAMVGNVGWRLNEQTFDGTSLTYAVDGFEVQYSYANRAQRIFGNDGDDAPAGSPLKNFEGDFHFLDSKVDVGQGELGGYTYLVDVNNNAAVGRNNTFGVHYKLDGLHLETAWQDGESALVEGSDYDAMYGHIKYGKKVGGAIYGSGFEYLEENFKTPFSTVHAFNGFADAFITQRIGVTNAKGYEGLGDLYVSYTRPNLPWGCTFKGVAHYFVNDGLSDAYGAEVDGALIKKFNDNLGATLKAAFFFEDDGPGGFGDIQQVSLQVDYSF